MKNQENISTQYSRLVIAELRKAISAAAGRPMILACHNDPDSLKIAHDHSIAQLFECSALTKNTFNRFGILPLTGRNVTSYSAKLQNIFSNVDVTDLAPRLILDKDLGICTSGRTAAEAQLVFETSVNVLATAKSAIKQTKSAQQITLEDEIKNRQLKLAAKGNNLFAGEVALITGAASGIGKACVESLLERGAAVVGLDINPAITNLNKNPAFLGIICDLSNEAEIINALETTVQTFGGLDMLVLNAGIFPASCKIEALQLAEWHKSFNINVDANLILLRESYPLFKLAARHGRVAVNSSRNVPAPGPAAASYSASKAALTQLARVAALEWGKDHINVNIVNPHAVFDTGLWTDEVLKNRAANYNMTIAQYKTNNVLHVELTSRDVAEMLTEMCGPLFEKTTGAQVPMDGGSDRVI
ncbi:MAG: SDR family NAD(P)-dependent oxidoreductase [Anaerolineaceae bacterium]|jgi:NAD(P)-dependent dehydrogenase (short-subunit alcohol dehydrogenase family)